MVLRKTNRDFTISVSMLYRYYMFTYILTTCRLYRKNTGNSNRSEPVLLGLKIG